MAEAVHLTSRPDLDTKFWQWRAAHPEVEAQLVRMARRLLSQGYRRFPFRLLWESLRYRYMTRRRPTDGDYVCNDHVTARWSRFLMASYVDLAGCFETRERREVTP